MAEMLLVIPDVKSYILDNIHTFVLTWLKYIYYNDGKSWSRFPKETYSC